MHRSISHKINRVLQVISLLLILILIRVWYLSVIQHDLHVEKARKPQRRSMIEKVERGTIRDRFNIPLALNKIRYDAAVCYADIRQIPSFKFEKTKEGKRIKIRARAEYIQKLAQVLANELHLDAQEIEDIIHAKASLFPHTPFVIKQNLTEEEFHRLKMLEMTWVGIYAERNSQRYYPLGKTGADVIGYMGAINSIEYYRIAHEIKLLQSYLNAREANEMPMLPKGFQNPLQVRERLKELQEKAYTIHDLIGKTGIEGRFDADLRGFTGKKTYEVDTKGNLMRELPGGRKSIPGQRVVLSLSSELQELAEKLLADNEKIREGRLPDEKIDWSLPWIKGGAIVVMDPNNGEVLALASYPRFDPNDFIPTNQLENKPSQVIEWLENEAYVKEIWNGERPMRRERFDWEKETFYTESIFLTLNHYLETILPPNLATLGFFKTLSSIKEAIDLQEAFDALCQPKAAKRVLTTLFKEPPHIPFSSLPPPEEIKTTEAGFASFVEEQQKIQFTLKNILHNDDKLLILDLCRMLVPHEYFDQELKKAIGHLSLSDYFQLNQAATRLQQFLKKEVKKWHKQIIFQKWREEHFKDYLLMKRKEEKANKKYTRPYTDYLEKVENEMFLAFWQTHRFEFLHTFIMDQKLEFHEQTMALSDNISVQLKENLQALQTLLFPLETKHQIDVLKAMRSFEELDRPLMGKYRFLRNSKGEQLEKHLAAAFYPLGGYGYGRSQAFRQSTPQGSVFKLLIGYQGLLERFSQLKEEFRSFEDLNPLTLIDSIKWDSQPGNPRQVLGYLLNGESILRFYKGGKLPRSHPNIGKIDLIGAIEQSSNIYFSILSGDHIQDPSQLIQTSKAFGFGEKTGIELPGEIAGVLPDDLMHNKTGLYSFSIGQHSLVVTPLQTAVMLSAIANKGKVLKPKIVHLIAGQERPLDYKAPFFDPKTAFHSDHFKHIGIHFPLFTMNSLGDSEPAIWYQMPEIKRTLFFPDAIRTPLIEGMHRAIYGPKGTARPQIIHTFFKHPAWKKDYLDLKNQWIGKTGTAEIMYKQAIDAESKPRIHNHIWFGGVCFEEMTPQTWEKPELVVVVYLRFSEAGGKEAAPLAAQIIKKWREIKER